jgi:DNA end-binding protein Ku
MAQAIWKGVIEFGSVSVPVKFFSAVQERGIHFNLLHDKDQVRVQQRMVDPETGEPVPSDAIRKGFEVEKGVFVVLDEQELESLEPEPSRTIQIEGFVPTARVSHSWYERPYFLGPDGESGHYAALVEALRGNEVHGLARWVMRKRQYVGSLQVSQHCLMMMSLRTADEVVPVESLPRPEGRKLEPKELELAAQLIAALHSDFDPKHYQDEYRQRVLDLIEQKAKGRKPRLRVVRPKRTREPEDLAGVLAASLRSARKEKRSA